MINYEKESSGNSVNLTEDLKNLEPGFDSVSYYFRTRCGSYEEAKETLMNELASTHDKLVGNMDYIINTIVIYCEPAQQHRKVMPNVYEIGIWFDSSVDISKLPENLIWTRFNTNGSIIRKITLEE